MTILQGNEIMLVCVINQIALSSLWGIFAKCKAFTKQSLFNCKRKKYEENWRNEDRNRAKSSFPVLLVPLFFSSLKAINSTLIVIFFLPLFFFFLVAFYFHYTFSLWMNQEISDRRKTQCLAFWKKQDLFDTLNRSCRKSIKINRWWIPGSSLLKSTQKNDITCLLLDILGVIIY